MINRKLTVLTTKTQKVSLDNADTANITMTSERFNSGVTFKVNVVSGTSKGDCDGFFSGASELVWVRASTFY